MFAARMRLAAVAAAALGALAAPGVAAADLDWQAAQVLTPLPAQGLGLAQLAESRDGDAIAGWLVAPSTNHGGTVGASFGPGGRPFDPPQSIATVSADTSLEDVDAAIDARGDAVVAWTQLTNGGSGSEAALRAAVRSPDGTVGPVQDVVTSSSVADFAFDVTMLPDGTALLVYDAASGSPPFISDGVEAVTRPPGGDWGTPQELAGHSTIPPTPRVTSDPRGNAVAAFDHSEDVAPTPRGRLQAAARSAGAGAFAAAEDVTPDGSGALFFPILTDLRSDDHGAALVLWTWLGQNVRPPYFLAQRPPLGAFGAPQQLTPGNEPLVPTGSVGLGPDGDALVAIGLLAQTPPFENTLVTYARPAGSTFGAARPIAQDGVNLAQAFPAAGADGDLLLAFTGQSSAGATAQAMQGTPDGPFDAPRTVLGGPGFQEATTLGAALDRSGNARVLGRTTDSAGNAAIVAALGTPPAPPPPPPPPPGPAGPSGANGAAGANGTAGSPGTAGLPGPSGESTTVSTVGLPTVHGVPGIQRVRSDGSVPLGQAHNPPTAVVSATLKGWVGGGGAARVAARRRFTVLGRGTTNVPAGQSRTVAARLSRTTLALLRRRGRMRVLAVLTVRGADGTGQRISRALTLRAT